MIVLTETSVGVNVGDDFPLGFGMEVGYVDLGEFGADLTVSAPGFSESERVSAELSAV